MSSKSKEAQEIKQLKSQLKAMDVLLQQNAALEKEVERLCGELDEATMGIQKKGYLYKWRDREVYYASKWALRYFVLQGNKISYYGDDREHRPKRTIDLSKCFVREDGTKKGGLYHAFSIYLGSSDNSLEGSLLLRLSTESAAEARLWIDMLEQACACNDEQFTSKTPEVSPKGKNVEFAREDDWAQKVSIEINEANNDNNNSEINERMKSSSTTLKKSLSRQTLARKILSDRAPNDFSKSGTRLSQLNDEHTKKQHSSTTNNNHKLINKDIPKSFPAYKPMHIKSAPSPLSADTKPGDHNYRGFFNLGLIILAVTHCDLIVNNISHYGFKLPAMLPDFSNITPITLHDVLDSQSMTMTLSRCMLSWLISILIQFILEKIASRGYISEKIMLIINFIVGTCNILIPCYSVWYGHAHPGLNMIYLFQSTILWMKLISYAHANKDLRVAYKKSKLAFARNNSSGNTSSDDLASMSNNNGNSNDKDGVTGKPLNYLINEAIQRTLAEVKDVQPPFLQYPNNLTLMNLGYFCIAPTLCYQLNYPRSPTIRRSYIALIIFRLVFVGLIILYAVEQYIKPTLETSILPMKEKNILKITERLLKLSLPSTYVWLLGFYWFFHLWLNLLAEITRFGDRQFYKDWWNAKSIDRYWRTWNMPVHHWIARHLYHPLIRVGANRIVASFVVFAFSALLHELIISVPFRYIAFHAFLGMFAQAPLILLTKIIDKRYDNSFIGNAMFWCIFCIVGQPMGVIMYYYDLWRVANNQ